MANTPLEKPDIGDIGFKKPSLFSDIVVRCGEREWKAHRVVLSMRSRFFEKACTDNFKEGITGEIILHEDDPEIVDRMIDFLYRQDYDDEQSSLETHAYVYAIADKYEISSLKDLAILKSRRALKHEWEVGTDEIAAALKVTWTTTPQQDRGLRDLFILWIGDYPKPFCKKELYIETIKSNADLAMDIIQLLTGRIDSGVFWCPLPGCEVNRTVETMDCGHSYQFALPHHFSR